jgi:hypothetical protein
MATLTDLTTDRSGHTVSWTLGPDSITSTFQCHNGVGAWCRSWCSAGCDERCTAPDEHPVGDTGSCFVLPYMDSTDARAEEIYAGEDETDLRNGEVEFTWDSGDDCYLWTYAEDAQSGEPG